MAFDSTNYINTWNNSSVLQGQFPNVNDYVDLFRNVNVFQEMLGHTRSYSEICRFTIIYLEVPRLLRELKPLGSKPLNLNT